MVNKNFEKIKNDFFNNGWAKYDSCLNFDEVEKINYEIEKFIKEKSKELKTGEIHLTDKGDINTIHVMSQESKFFSDLLNSTNFKNLSEYILEEDVEPQWAQLFNKPKMSGLSAPFHQDNFYWNVLGNKTVTIWLALDYVNENNGGLSYFSKSHKMGLLKHEPTYAKGTSQKVPDNIVDKLPSNTLIIPTLKPGDVLLHHGLTIHGSLPNKSEKNRRGMSFWYKSVSAKYDEFALENYRKSLKDQHEKFIQADSFKKN